MADEAQKTTITQTTTRVVLVCKAYGRNQTNPPSLGHLREFVAACEGLPDDTAVSLEKGQLTEAGRYSYKFSLTIVRDGGQ